VKTGQDNILAQVDSKKMMLTQYLQLCINGIENYYQEQIVHRSSCERLFTGIPDQVILERPKELDQPAAARPGLGVPPAP
jgi:hypothetical protein